MEYQARILGAEEYGEWDAFVASHSLGNVHQTSKWGVFQATKGKAWKFWILGVFCGEILTGGALVLRRSMPGGRGWLYIPKGPLLGIADGDGGKGGAGGSEPEEKSGKWTADTAFLQMDALLQVIKPLARAEKALFLRVESGLVAHGPRDFGVHSEMDWGVLGFRPSYAHYQPEHTLVVNLEGGEADILVQMKPKGRYNIKVARKKGVEVKEDRSEEAVGHFHKILEETTSRDGFAGHPREYYLEMLEKLGPDMAKLYLARYEGHVIAGIIVTFYKDLAIYYFGASAGEYRNVMAPYALQWEAMQEATKRGCKWYDFLGTAPLTEENGELGYDQKHSWAGVTEFKLKFGGKKVDFQGGQELILAPAGYWFMRAAKWLLGLRRLIRRGSR